MKNKIFILLFILLNLIFISNNNSYAAECSSADPCGGWAMVSPSGEVTNIIVCQPSVCGGGTFAGQRVVPQTAPNSVTHDTTGVGGIMSGDTIKVTENSGTFTVKYPGNVTKTEIEIVDDGNTRFDISTTVSEEAHSFRYEDTIGKEYVGFNMRDAEPSDDTKATILVKKTTGNTSEEQSNTFEKRKTYEDINDELVRQNLNILLSKIQNIIKMLNKWVK